MCTGGVFSDTKSLQSSPTAVESSCLLSLGANNLELSSAFVCFGFSGNCIFASTGQQSFRKPTCLSFLFVSLWLDSS